MGAPEADYPVIPDSRADDIKNLEFMEGAHLRVFMAGNQFMVMEELLAAFREERPEVRKVFYETLPPGLELRQILSGGALFRGRLLTGRPDVYTSVSSDAMETLRERGLITDYSVYLHNRLALMVARGNPAGIRGVADLGRDDVRVSQPGELEDISGHIREMYLKAGGEALARKVLEEKAARGTTILTVVHHRETPRRIIEGEADVGPVWHTEVVHARAAGMALEAVEPGAGLDQRERVNYYAASLASAPNPENARAFVGFLTTGKARRVFEKHGFMAGG
jgi:ABC-type molybdate transport system substrate-binding protein